MRWTAYEIVLRLRSPLHIGWSKIGNLQRTRPYVTGRVLWGALTERLTRDKYRGEATTASHYRAIGEQVHESLAFTYLYPALKAANCYNVLWPWPDERRFQRRLLSSYQSTALVYPAQSAAEGMLHETEYIAPRTLDTGEAVFLKGYIFARAGCPLRWQEALQRLQIGGERGYGWGSVERVECREIETHTLFDTAITCDLNQQRPIIQIPANERILAHTIADPATLIAGSIEPLVGREWRADAPVNRYAGQHVTFHAICYTPGSVMKAAVQCTVGKFGVWETTTAASAPQ